ncbi:hypothetical protein FACS189472_16660 [Alphaproteobacteria bacterium]|nr:hypothetical protein FACS189472_16660 [Alphaproteobacteria bacterium]
MSKPKQYVNQNKYHMNAIILKANENTLKKKAWKYKTMHINMKPEGLDFYNNLYESANICFK